MRFVPRLSLLAIFPLVSAAACSAGCSSQANAVGPGGECELATDCAPGLVCIPQSNGTRACSNDLSSVQHPPDHPARDAGTTPQADAGPSSDAAPASDATSPRDSAPPPVDTGAPPPVDAETPDVAPPADTGAPD